MAAELMALQRQLDASQWWKAVDLRSAQWQQLRLLIAYAAKNVPFHARRLREAGIDPDGPFTEEDWLRLPTLTRRELQARGDGLVARQVPKSHGAVTVTTSGGSSGVPVRVRKTALDNLMWNAFHVREELWHRDDPTGTMARIRRVPPGVTEEQETAIKSLPGLRVGDWGAPTNLLWETGEVVLLDDRVPIVEQAAFLDELKPAYLFVFPANLRLLLSHYRESGRSGPPLRAVWTLSEAVDSDMRAACRAVFGCRIVHNYTSAEGGYMALQCPEHEEHYHVQSEGILLEVLDDAGQHCAPGQVGRVVITPLHNFAMPLLRYEIGDMAELGPPCTCGRGLPVLRRIVGRNFDFVTLPDGRRQRVDAGFGRIGVVSAIREFQIVQRSLERIELLVVLSRPLTEAEETAIRTELRTSFTDVFQFDLTPCDSIPRTAAGKLRIFVSDLTTGTA